MKKIIFYIYKKCWDIIANPIQDPLQFELLTAMILRG